MAGREHVRKSFKDYESLIADDEDRRLLEAERASFDRYNKNIDEVLDVPGIDAVDLDGLELRADLSDATIPVTVNALLQAGDGRGAQAEAHAGRRRS